VIFHADRGTQYTSVQLAEACQHLPMLQSVGRTGVCWDCETSPRRQAA
jgi:transposase InsO family protein